MAALRSYTIPVTQPTYVRVGIKWDPLERDNIDEIYGLGSAENAQAQLDKSSRRIRTFKWVGEFFRIFLLNKLADRIDGLREQELIVKKDMQTYLTQKKVRSYDLDLCCFCYDANGKLAGFISPVFMGEEYLPQGHRAFLHTGDDATGIGDAFDEELLVNLHAVDAGIHAVYFIAVSINHGFDQIKGGFWSIVRTKDETELLSLALQTKLRHRVHVMAKLSRGDGAWTLDEIAEYCPLDPDEKIDLHQRVDRLLVEHYMVWGGGAKAPA